MFLCEPAMDANRPGARKIAKEGSRVLVVTPHCKEAPLYELLQDLTVRHYEWRGKLYLTEGVRFKTNTQTVCFVFVCARDTVEIDPS